MLRIIQSRRAAFTLVEIMIVVGLISLLAMIAVPQFIRARQRAQASTILNEARQLDAAKDQYALETQRTGTMVPVWNDLTPYLKVGSRLAVSGGTDLVGNPFSLNTVSVSIQVHSSTQSSLTAATGGSTFWGPYS